MNNHPFEIKDRSDLIKALNVLYLCNIRLDGKAEIKGEILAFFDKTQAALKEIASDDCSCGGRSMCATCKATEAIGENEEK